MRTITDIIPPSRRRETESFTSMNEPISQMPIRPSGQVSKFPYKTLVAIVLVIAASLGALYYFSSAKVEITPTTISAAVQSSFTATKDTGDLSYEIISSQKIASQSVQSSGVKTVTSSASGQITVYNTQSKAQKLITNTRFATTAGLIFRIHAPVVVPAGTAAKPGSVVVTVYADKPGDSYNVSPTSFTIPGFAGTPQASQVYARSSVAMTGGASGNVPVVDAIVEASARHALAAALAPELTASLQALVPSGYVLIPGSATTTFQDVTTAVPQSADKVDIKEQGTITAVVFPSAALAKAIAMSVSGLDYQGGSLSFLPASDLKLTSASLPDAQATSFTFTLSGTAAFVYAVDSTHIAAVVAGKTRAEAEVALTNYPEVKRALLILRPFWRQTFPQDPSQITVTTVTP